MVGRLSKRFQKILLVKAVLDEYQGDKLTNSELINFAHKLIKLAEEEEKNEFTRVYSEVKNYYSKDVYTQIKFKSFSILENEYSYFEVFEEGCLIDKNLKNFKTHIEQHFKSIWSL